MRALLPDVAGPTLLILTLLVLLSSLGVFIVLNQERLLGSNNALAFHKPHDGR